MSDESTPTGKAIAQAFLKEIGRELQDCDGAPNQRGARHRVQTLSELTRDTNRAISAAGLQEETKDALREVIQTGRRVSEQTKRICGECDNLYDHEPPDTTTEMCAFCTAEAAREEDPE